MNAVMTIAVLAVIAWGQIPSNGLVLWVPFTGNYLDESGSNIQLTITPPLNPPPPTIDRYSVANRAYSFNGSSQWFSGKDSLLPAGSNPRTVCAWVCYSSGGNINGQTIVSYGKNEAGKLFRFYVKQLTDGSGKFIKISNLTDSLSFICTDGAKTGLTDGVWVHVATVINGATTQLFINGGVVATGTITSWNTEYYGLGIGAQYVNNLLGNSTFKGNLDDICIYNKALTVDQIHSIYQSTSTKNTVPRITSMPNINATTGSSYIYNVTVSDPDAGATTSLTLTQNPSGMVLIGNQLRWTPTISQVGNYSVTIKITDNIEDTSNQMYTIQSQPPTNVILAHVGSQLKPSQNRAACYSVSGRKILKVQKNAIIIRGESRKMILEK